MNCAVTSHNIVIQSTQDLQQLYPDRFNGIGKFPEVHKLTTDENVTPVKHAPRRAPIQLRDKIKSELERMVNLDVIRPVETPTDWVSCVTYAQKTDGSLRICLDPKDVNNALKRGHHHTPTAEELTHRFASATHFSKLDAKSGYWAVQLDSDSQLLTTFNSLFGRFCFTRLPVGLKTSQDVFQRAMDSILDGLPGVVSIADDITVYGIEHDRHLHGLMMRAREKGLIFNPQKMPHQDTRSTFLWEHLQQRRGSTRSCQGTGHYRHHFTINGHRTPIISRDDNVPRTIHPKAQ